MSRWSERFAPGSVIRLDPKYATGSWKDFTTGTVLGPTINEGYGSSAGTRYVSSDGTKYQSWRVRWDGFDYGPSKDNCHTVADAIVTAYEPDERELADVMASIENAARNTMSKEAPHDRR